MPRLLWPVALFLLCLALPVGTAAGGGIPISVADDHAVESLYLQPGGPHVRHEMVLDVDVRDIAHRDDHIFIAAGDDGLVVLETRGHKTPEQLVRLRLSAPASRIRLHGDIAWLTGPAGMTSVDISNPEFPDVIMEYPLPVAPRDIALGHERAWLLLDREILTFDLSFPGAPIMIGRNGLRFDAHALAVRHDRAWLAAGDGGLITFDVRRPPPHAAGMTAGGTITDVAVDGDRIHAAGGAGGITIVEGAGVDGMRWLGNFRVEAPLRRLTVDGGRALAITGDDHLYLLDVANPEAMRVTTLLSRACCDAWHLDGDTALTLNDRRLTVYDLAPAPPQTGNEGLALGQGVNLGGQRRVFIDHGIAHVADWFAGLHLYDLDDPIRPRLLASLALEGSAKGVVVRDGIAFVADDDHGLQVVDVGDPRAPRRIARLDLPGLAYTPVLDGDRLWLAVHDAGIVAIDVADPAAPRLLAHYETPGKAWSLRVRDDIAWVADDDAGLLILDVADLEAIRVLGGYDPGGRAEEVLLDGDVAYVAYFDAGIYLLDIGDPAAPRRLANITTAGNPRGLDLRGDRLHVADWRAGVQVIDVAEPAAPRLLGRLDTDGAAWGLQAFGDHLFVADWWGGIAIVDVSDPARPAAAGGWPRRAPVRAIATTGSHAYLAQSTAGVQVFDIDNPLNPTWVTGVDLDAAEEIVIAGDRAVVLDGGDLVVLELGAPTRPRPADAPPVDKTIVRLAPAGDRVLLIGDDAVSRFDPASGDIHPLIDGREVRDAAAAGDHVAVVTDRGLEIVDRDGHSVARHLADRAASLTRVAASGARVAVVDGDALHILSITGDERHTVRIPLADVVRDLHFAGDRLHVVTARPGVLTLDLANPADWRVIAWQPTLGDIHAVTPHRNALYLAGTDRLLAVKSLPPAHIERTGPDSIVIDTPSGLAPGAWDLATSDPAPPGPVLRHGVVRVAPLPFGGRQMSRDEFDALMEQHLRERE